MSSQSARSLLNRLITIERRQIYHDRIMFTYQDLADRYGISYKQVRDRMTAIGEHVEPFLEDGKKNTRLLNNSGLAIFDRLIQIERDDNLTIKAAAAVLSRELESNGNGAGVIALGEEFTQLQNTVAEQGDTIAKLSMRVEEHRKKIEHLQTQVNPMLPSNILKVWWSKLFHRKDNHSSHNASSN